MNKLTLHLQDLEYEYLLKLMKRTYPDRSKPTSLTVGWLIFCQAQQYLTPAELIEAQEAVKEKHLAR